MLGTMVVAAALFVADISAAFVGPVSQAAHMSAPAVAPPDRAALGVLADLNSKRAAHHCAPLVIDTALSQVAGSQAEDLAVHHSFSHTSSDGKSPFERMNAAHITYGYAAENIALDDTIPSAEVALWNSPGHRENILGEHYAHVGIAFAKEDGGQIVVVEDFTD